jgi:hypothetical protein
MKKMMTVTLFTLLLLHTKAQTVSVNYVNQFVSESKSPFTNNKFAPYAASGYTVAFSQALKKLPLTVNASASRTRRNPPPRYIKYPDPRVISKWAKDNKIEADSASFSGDKSYSIDVLAGIGYILPHKEDSRFIVTLNADFGVAFTDKVAVNYYFQKKLTGSAEQNKTQLIINPNVKATYFVTDKIGIGLQLGYSNIGSVNAGVGVTIAPKGRKITFPPNGGLR